MNVRELIERLQDMDPEAEVLFMSQPSWPFEYSIQNIVTRGDIEEAESNFDDTPLSDRDYHDGEKQADVFLIEGSQLRYGSKAAWDAV